MNKLDLHLIYSFGKALTPLTGFTEETTRRNAALPLLTARDILDRMAGSKSPLLGTARRAVGKLTGEIDAVVARDFDAMIQQDMEEPLGWRASRIGQAVSDLESVLGNDMPGIAAYLVVKKGIYDTDDLITNAERQLNDETATHLPHHACDDLQAAGKCLAYALPTACAFHLWRAVETVADAYHQALTGKTFKEAKVTRTWSKYIEALNVAHADSEITKHLNFIRHKYRNPQTHPTENVTPGKARGLFSVATGVIDQMLDEISAKKAGTKTEAIEDAPMLDEGGIPEASGS